LAPISKVSIQSLPVRATDSPIHEGKNTWSGFQKVGVALWLPPIYTDNWLAEEHWQAAFRKDYDDWFEEDND
jgi:hypothetical protein